MVVSLPQATDPLNAPDHSKLHRVIAGDLAASDQTLSITNGVVDVLASSVLRWNAADLNSDYLLEMRVAGDTDPRFQIRADGRLEWGGGAGALDTMVVRGGANILEVLDELRVKSSPFTAYHGNGTWPAFRAQADGDAAYRLQIDRSGLIEWGSGAGAVDCEVSRNAANELRTPDQFTAQGGVATLVKAGVPGDGDFATAIDGLLAVDTAANKLYIRSSGGWVLVGP